MARTAHRRWLEAKERERCANFASKPSLQVSPNAPYGSLTGKDS
jgi:hypothetical protein